MVVALVWIVLAFLVGFAGADKKIGYWGTFGISLLLSPLIGLIVGLVSGPKVPPMSSGEVEYNKWINVANEHIKTGRTAEAIDAIQTALRHHGGNPFAHYNLACLYTKQQMRDEAYFNLSAAVAKGYTKLDNISSDPQLQWLRSTEDWSGFVRRGYKMSDVQAPLPISKVDQLEKLAKLKDSGVLTQAEFETEKAKLLA